jgi:hypothetical protein
MKPGIAIDMMAAHGNEDRDLVLEPTTTATAMATARRHPRLQRKRVVREWASAPRSAK